MKEFYSRFLTQGAFVRLSSTEVHLWAGIFQPSSREHGSLGLCPFWQQGLDFFEFSEQRVLAVQELHRDLEALMGPLKVQAGQFKAPDRGQLETSFQATQGRIQRGEIEKAVVIGTKSSNWIPSVPERASMMMKALQAPAKTFPYGYWNSEGGAIGVTPEILFQRLGDEVLTMALAGSCPKEEVSQRAPLLKDPKELREHQMVVKDISERLRQQGWLVVKDTEVMELPTLLHLKTEIEVKQCKKNDEELVQLLHPTAAMAQFPRNYGLQWMKDLPYQKDRGLHGGAVWFRFGKQEGLDRSIALVSIRSLFWDKEKSWMTAGCGIVTESQEEREWNEMLAKLSSIHKALGIVE